MNKVSKSLLLASIGAAVLAGQAQAQSFNYNSQGDVLLSFRTPATPNNNLVVDLGDISQFLTAKGEITLGQFGNGAGQVNASIINGGKFDGLTFSASAATTVNGPTGAKTLFVTEARTSGSADATLAGSTAFLPGSKNAEGGTASKIQSVGVNATSFGTSGHILANGVMETPDAGNSYHNFVTDAGNFGAGTFAGSVENSFSGGASFVRSDFYELDAGASTAKYLGYFQLNSDGTAVFNSAVPAPEPMTYGFLGGIGLLMVSVRRQLKRQ